MIFASQVGLSCTVEMICMQEQRKRGRRASLLMSNITGKKQMFSCASALLHPEENYEIVGKKKDYNMVPVFLYFSFNW